MSSTKKLFSATALVFASALALSGCSLLYPHWGQTAMPTKTASQSPTATKTAEPSQTPSETPTKDSGLKKATPEITDVSIDTDSNTLEVSAEIPEVFEEGGTCTATVVSDGNSVAVSAKAILNVNDIVCLPLSIDLAKLSSGDATVTVSYKSSVYEGKSATVKVAIP